MGKQSSETRIRLVVVKSEKYKMAAVIKKIERGLRVNYPPSSVMCLVKTYIEKPLTPRSRHAGKIACEKMAGARLRCHVQGEYGKSILKENWQDDWEYAIGDAFPVRESEQISEHARVLREGLEDSGFILINC